jgi:hypothetical protein
MADIAAPSPAGPPPTIRRSYLEGKEVFYCVEQVDEQVAPLVLERKCIIISARLGADDQKIVPLVLERKRFKFTGKDWVLAVKLNM